MTILQQTSTGLKDDTTQNQYYMYAITHNTFILIVGRNKSAKTFSKIMNNEQKCYLDSWVYYVVIFFVLIVQMS